jgi:thioredoxin 1
MRSIASETDFNVDNGCYAIKFWATWCGPCRVITPVLKKLDDEFNDVDFLSIDIDQVPTLAQKFKVRSLPTVLFIEDGKEMERLSGVHLIGPMREALQSLNRQAHDTEEEDIVIKPAEVSTG